MSVRHKIEQVWNECKFQATPSSGPGGQHVNKVSSRIELRFNIEDSLFLSDEEKNILLDKLGGRLSASGFLIIVSQEERSQYKNKEKAKQKFLHLMEESLKPIIPRKSTKPSKAAKEKRLESKRIKSSKKEQRKPPEME